MRRILSVIALVVSGVALVAQAPPASAGAVTAQTLTFTPTAFPTGLAAGASFPVSVVASSGLPVTIKTVGDCTGGGTGTATVTLTTPVANKGNCAVEASQAGTASVSGPPQCFSGLTSDVTSPDKSAVFTLNADRSALAYELSGSLAVVTLTLHLADGSALSLTYPTGRTSEPGVSSTPPQPIVSYDVCKQTVIPGFGAVTKAISGSFGGENPPPSPSLEYVPVAKRILETRDTCWRTPPNPELAYVPTGYTPTSVPANRQAARLAAGTTIELQVTGAVDIAPSHCGVAKVQESPVPTGTKAVALNVTGVNATADGYVTVWDCTAPTPVTSNLNLVATPVIENWDRDAHAKLVVTKLSDRGTVCLYTQSGTDLVVDLQGYFPGVSGYAPITGMRAADTRLQGGPIGAGQTLHLGVAGTGGPLPTDTGAVVMNLTGLGVPTAGFLTVWDCVGPVPNTSNLNLVPGQTDSTLVVSKVGSDGSICIFASSGAHVVVDVSGSFPKSLVGTCPSGSKCFVPLEPTRVLDTRPGSQVGYTGAKPAAGAVVHVHVSATPITAVLTVTSVDATKRGYVTAWDCVSSPFASNLNMEQGKGAVNVAIVPTSPTGDVCLFTQSGAHFVVDFSGAFPLGT